MDTKFIEEIGLSKKEAEVYLSLLKGYASIPELIKQTKVSRKGLHEILQKLLGKGLTSYTIKNNKKRFIATGPDRLIEILKERETNLESILPELLKLQQKNKEETNVEIFLGKEGIKTITNNILKVGKPLYVLDGEGKIFDFLKYFMPQLVKKRAKLKINANVIYDENVRGKGLEVPLAKIRYAPEKYSSPISIAIYGNNVNLTIFSENPVAIHIENKEIAKSFMNYFNLMWRVARK